MFDKVEEVIVLPVSSPRDAGTGCRRGHEYRSSAVCRPGLAPFRDSRQTHSVRTVLIKCHNSAVAALNGTSNRSTRRPPSVLRWQIFMPAGGDISLDANPGSGEIHCDLPTRPTSLSSDMSVHLLSAAEMPRATSKTWMFLRPSQAKLRNSRMVDDGAITKIRDLPSIGARLQSPSSWLIAW